MKLRPARWQWITENGKSGLRPRPTGSRPNVGRKEAPENDVITAPIPTVALLQAARAMTDPEPPIDLGLYRAFDDGAEEVSESVLLEPVSEEEPPRSTRRSRPAPPLAAEFGLDHLIEEDWIDGQRGPRRNWSLWLRAHSLWIVAAVLLMCLIASFALRSLAISP